MSQAGARRFLDLLLHARWTEPPGLMRPDVVLGDDRDLAAFVNAEIKRLEETLGPLEPGL